MKGFLIHGVKLYEVDSETGATRNCDPRELLTWQVMLVGNMAVVAENYNVEMLNCVLTENSIEFRFNFPKLARQKWLRRLFFLDLKEPSLLQIQCDFVDEANKTVDDFIYPDKRANLL